MKKNFDDYLNDSDIENESSALREIHAIRLMLYDETKDMTVAEKTAYYHECTAKFSASAN
jgi:hypothetical protein